jgi:hypothetical protein
MYKTVKKLKEKKRYKLQDHTLELYVKKSPVLVRGTFLFLAFLSIVLPLAGIILSAIAGTDFHMKYIIILGVCSLIGFFFIRLFLWNSYGKEVFEWKATSLSYYVDYLWFKGNHQHFSFEQLTVDYVVAGFQEEEIGHLLFVAMETEFIESAVNLPIPDLLEIIETLVALSRPKISLHI